MGETLIERAEDGVGSMWKRAFCIWILIIFAESVHGTLREMFVSPLLGDMRARQLGVVTGSVMILAIATLSAGWLGLRETRMLITVGLLWVFLTVAFEIVLGVAIFGYSWERVRSDYDIGAGGLMPLGLIVLLFAPLIASRLRKAGGKAGT